MTICRAATMFVTFLWAAIAHAEPATQCTAIGVCYCINGELKLTLDKNIAILRELISTQRAAGKAIGYLSVPLSSAGGGYFDINKDVAAKTKEHVLDRLGRNSVWVLDPGAPEADLPPANRRLTDLVPLKAAGADYMYMWTYVLEGVKGLGEDFDFVYFVGPSDFARHLHFTGFNDMAWADELFEAAKLRDKAFAQAVSDGKITKDGFRNYYTLRASVSFSNGAHDEWNIARILNERRRGNAQYGNSGQLSIFFDGRPVPPSDYQASVASGYAGACTK